MLYNFVYNKQTTFENVPFGLEETRPVRTGFKIAVRPKLLTHIKTKLHMGLNNLVVIVL